MKDIPRTFLFFFRTMGLMRGLCASLDVKLPYLDILAVYARKVSLKAFLAAHDCCRHKGAIASHRCPYC